MTYLDQTAMYFDKAFKHYEGNRMYPQGYGKESPVTKLHESHIKAVRRARSLMNLALSTTNETSIREEMESDIRKLTQVITALQYNTDNPNFPYFDHLSEASVELDIS